MGTRSHDDWVAEVNKSRKQSQTQIQSIEKLSKIAHLHQSVNGALVTRVLTMKEVNKNNKLGESYKNIFTIIPL